jgi:hypothetical protein
MEYARHKFQKSVGGKAGLNLWRWRVYLKPPRAPKPLVEKWKAYAEQQARLWKLKPKWAPTRVSTISARKNLIRRR